MTAPASGKAPSGRTALICGGGRLAAAVAARLDDPLVTALEGHAPDGLAAEAKQREQNARTCTPDTGAPVSAAKTIP